MPEWGCTTDVLSLYPHLSNRRPGDKKMSFQDPGRAPRLGGDTALTRLQDDLKDLRRLTDRSTDRRLQADLAELLDDAELRARAVEREWTRRAPSDAARDREIGREVQATRAEIERRVFDELLKDFKQASFDSDRLSLLRLAFRSFDFTCSQAWRLLKSFAGDPDRRRAVVSVYSHLVDPREFPTLATTFRRPAEWEAACRELNVRPL